MMRNDRSGVGFSDAVTRRRVVGGAFAGVREAPKHGIAGSVG